MLIEGFGPVSRSPATAASALRKALDEESKFHSKDITIDGGRLYSSVHEAVSLCCFHAYVVKGCTVHITFCDNR